MKETRWEVLIDVFGGAQAEVIRGFLESNKIPVQLEQEGYSSVTFGQFGNMQILVPNNYLEEARKLLHSRGWKFDTEEVEA